jgi:hypothetical protein
MKDIKVNDLMSFLRKLTYEQIQLGYNQETLYKGLKYYEQHRVMSTSRHGINELLADVYGRAKYTVKIEFSNHELHDHCSCFIGGSCKHVVAVLLHCINNLNKLENQDITPLTSDVKKVEHYLQNLNKAELIELILKFASENFIEYITIKDLEIDQSKKLFDKIAKQIDVLFTEDEVFDDPDSFESSLVALFEKLKGVWEKLPDETGDLIIKVIEKIDPLIVEGYLYDHYHDNTFEGFDFGKVVRSYICSLPFEEKMKFVLRANEVISKMEFTSFDLILINQYEFYGEEDKPMLKEYFLRNIETWDYGKVDDYYKLLCEDFSADEKELVLKGTYQSSGYLTLEFANFYKQRNDKDEAIHIIESYLTSPTRSNDNTEGLYNELLRLKKEKGLHIEDTATDALNKHASIPLLELIVEYIPDKQLAFEELIKEKDSQIYLEYLEKYKRISEAVQLVSESKWFWDETKHRFFIKYWIECPNEAESYFVKRIQTELDYTGNRHYYVIADSLSALKKIDTDKAVIIAQHIRIEYKRRTNLMEAIKNI